LNMSATKQNTTFEKGFKYLKIAAMHHLARMYSGSNAWAITAWPIEKLARETFGERYSIILENLRKNLYHYLSEIGAEWTEADEETGGFNILLPGTYIEAAKALKTLWLSLHLVYMTAANEPKHFPDPTDLYTLYESYIKTAKRLLYNSITFKQANIWLEAASYIALLNNPILPELFELLMLEKPIAAIISALALYMK